MTTISLLRGRYHEAARRLSALGWLPNAALRLSVGFMFASGAVGKLGDLHGFTALFQKLGIPQAAMAAPLVALLELVGGLALMLGLATRVTALLLGGTMAGALLTAVAPPLLDEHPGAWQFLSSLFYSPEWLLIGLLAWLVCVGGGKASLDALLVRRSPGPAEAAQEEDIAERQRA
jgi:putative oxidoreductase